MGLAQADGVIELQLRKHNSILTRLWWVGEYASWKRGRGLAEKGLRMPPGKNRDKLILSFPQQGAKHVFPSHL